MATASDALASITTHTFAETLIAWHRRHGRHDLPWQRDPTPYRVWVSEIMLQQTQVAAAIGYYDRFMQRFPDVATLATAPLDEVLYLWSGLGYYSRARNLHRAAQQIASECGGELPEDPSELIELPGIGRSTAAAIAALSRGRRAAILDGNVKRVLARVYGIEAAIGSGEAEKEFWRRAEECTPDRDVAAYTQAIMDFGAMLCTPKSPLCMHCPLQSDCIAYRAGRVQELPARRTRAARRTRHVVMLLATDRDGAVLLQRRAPQGVWGGLWAPPQFDSAAELSGFCTTRLGSVRLEHSPLALVRHGFTHFDLEITPWRARCESVPCVMDGVEWLWYNARQPALVGLPAPIALLISTLEPKT